MRASPVSSISVGEPASASRKRTPAPHWLVAAGAAECAGRTQRSVKSIAAENNLSETAFTVPRGEDFDLRWFTPTIEVDLCGHATLAAAFVLATERGVRANPFRFHSRSGVLSVSVEGNGVLTLDFPARAAVAMPAPEALLRGLGARPAEVLKARDYLGVFASEAEVRALQPDFAALKTLDGLGIIATAAGSDCDFVSRFFAPGAGIDEDPATGSSHCTLIPYWARRLGKTKLFARQVSARGGELFCEHVAVEEIAARFGTPCYIYSHQTLTRHFRAVDGADRKSTRLNSSHRT